jgi:hypothetical protein
MLEPDRPQLAFEERDFERGQQHARVLVDVRCEPLGVEVVAVQVRDVEEVGGRELGRIEPVVARKGKPRSEVGGIEPGIAQHRPATRFDVEADVPEERHSHRPPFWRIPVHVLDCCG